MPVLIHRNPLPPRESGAAKACRRRVRHNTRSIAVAAAAVAALLSAAAPQAHAATSAQSYVWADQPTRPDCYTPSPAYQRNSSGALNTICHAPGQAGVYTVSFPGLASAGGTVNVTAYGPGPETCKVDHWDPVGTAEQVIVRCFNGMTPTDTPFTASFTQPPATTAPATSPPFAYVLANQPASPGYTPLLTHQYNSTGAINTITHNSTAGDYTVRLPGIGEIAGTVKVTYYGSGTGSCTVAGWWPSGPDQLVRVRCFTAGGDPTDAFFTLTYASRVSVLGTPGPAYGYAWADQPSASFYVPNTDYQGNSRWFTNTISRSGPGRYTLRLPGLAGNGGDVQVTAYGPSPARCKVVDWWPSAHDEFVDVACSSPSGTPMDAYYTVQYTE